MWLQYFQYLTFMLNYSEVLVGTAHPLHSHGHACCFLIFDHKSTKTPRTKVFLDRIAVKLNVLFRTGLNQKWGDLCLRKPPGKPQVGALLEPVSFRQIVELQKDVKITDTDCKSVIGCSECVSVASYE